MNIAQHTKTDGVLCARIIMLNGCHELYIQNAQNIGQMRKVEQKSCNDSDSVQNHKKRVTRKNCFNGSLL